jgi:pimeloyl-ACP methyl ester carboxylesterase
MEKSIHSRSDPMLRTLPLMALVFLGSAFAPQDQFFDSGGVRIHYVEAGGGDPVLLVHGQTNSIQIWETAGIVDALAKDHRVIAFDLRGHGLSGKPHEPNQYGREMALDAVRLLDHLGMRRAHIVGYSLGAHLVSLLMTIAPDRFESATLVGAAGRFQWTADDDRESEQQASEIEKFGISPTMMRGLAPANAQPTEERIRQQSEAALADPSRDRFAMAALTRARHLQVITPQQVKAIAIPTLAVFGSLDPGLGSARELQKLRPSIRLVVVDGATHGGDRGILLRPEFLTALREFLRNGHGPAEAPRRWLSSLASCL